MFNKDLLIEVAKESAEKYVDNFQTPVLLIIKDDSEKIDSYLIQAHTEEEARQTIIDLLQVEKVKQYILIGKGKATPNFEKAIELSDIGLMPKDEYEEILMIAYVENDGVVEHYVCNVSDLDTLPFKGNWKKQKLLSIKNVVVREW